MSAATARPRTPADCPVQGANTAADATDDCAVSDGTGACVVCAGLTVEPCTAPPVGCYVDAGGCLQGGCSLWLRTVLVLSPEPVCLNAAAAAPGAVCCTC